MLSLSRTTCAGSRVSSTPEPCPREPVLLALFFPHPQWES